MKDTLLLMLNSNDISDVRLGVELAKQLSNEELNIIRETLLPSKINDFVRKGWKYSQYYDNLIYRVEPELMDVPYL